MQRWMLFSLFLFVPMAAIAQTASTGRVIFYRPQYAAIGTHIDSASVWIDEVKTVIVDRKRFAVAELPVGKHEFRSSNKRDVMVIDIQPGQTYHLREDVFQFRNVLLRVDADSAEAQSRGMKPVSPSSVLDFTFIVEPRPKEKKKKNR